MKVFEYPVKEERIWHSEYMYHMCRSEGFYTRGDNEEYCTLLCFVDDNAPTPQNIATAAQDILDHSDTDLTIESIMQLITKECTRCVYSIGEKEA